MDSEDARHTRIRMESNLAEPKTRTTKPATEMMKTDQQVVVNVHAGQTTTSEQQSSVLLPNLSGN
jgi:hypothetical protein